MRRVRHPAGVGWLCVVAVALFALPGPSRASAQDDAPDPAAADGSGGERTDAQAPNEPDRVGVGLVQLDPEARAPESAPAALPPPEPERTDDLLTVGLVAFALVVGVPTLAFLVTDLAYGAQELLLPTEGAVGQIIVAAFDLLAATTVLLAGEGSDFTLAIGLPLIGVAGWLIGHASASLAIGM